MFRLRNSRYTSSRSARSSPTGSRTLQKSVCRLTDEVEWQSETDDDSPGTKNDHPGTTTWQFRTTGPPRNLSLTPRLSRWTCPPGNLADSPRRRRRRRRIIPLRSLRCAAPAAPLLVTALFSFMFVPLLSLLLFVTCPSPSSFSPYF